MERDINGVAAVPIVATIMLMASRESVMGKFVLTKPLAILGWLATAVIAAAANRHVRDLRQLSSSTMSKRTSPI
jgi:Mn2+/Fe2+ NRAMP family transporter